MSIFFPVYRKRELIVRKGQQNRVYTFDVMDFCCYDNSVLVGHAVINIDSGRHHITVITPEKTVEEEVMDELKDTCFKEAKDIEKKIFEWFTNWGALLEHLKIIFYNRW